MASRKGYSVSENTAYIPYSRQTIDQEDLDAVMTALSSRFLTTGPGVTEFESAMCAYLKVRHGVAVSSGTAALHTAVNAAGIGEGDEVIVSPLTFAASANCVLYQRGVPVFADIDPDTMLISPASVADRITSKTRAVIAVDFAGQPCDYKALRSLCDRHGLILIADSAHSPGATFMGRSSAAWADLAAYSFHPVKHITSGEGGMVMTHHVEWLEKMRRFRSHGIDMAHNQRSRIGTWRYSMVELGYNYRISDFQCALALSQLKKLDKWLARRREIAALYDASFNSDARLSPLVVRDDVAHAYHLYVIRLAEKYGGAERQRLFEFLRGENIGVNVHYIPVYQHEYYIREQNGKEVDCPNTESSFQRILSIPMYSSLTDAQVQRVIGTVKRGLDTFP